MDVGNDAEIVGRLGHGETVAGGGEEEGGGGSGRAKEQHLL